MRTTLSINDELYREVKVEAARRGLSVTSVIEQALRAALRPQHDTEPPDFPISTRSSGIRSGINLTDPNDLYDLLYGDDDRRTALMAGVSARDDVPT